MINTLRNGTSKISRQTMKLDSALIKLLQLDPENTTVSSAGGGGCSSASTSKITSKDQDGREKTFFMKTGKGREAEIMFKGSTLKQCRYLQH
jgi:protein-ribulosamine 3-kinase